MCHKPGCNNHIESVDFVGERFCIDCYYPGIERDYERYRAYREDGYSIYQSKLNVGWEDPSEDD